ncbi:TadE family type IV pilus minor pilin [Pseudarthrobacter sp902506025]|uniref:TadE family type IV pilus minor pilin n=1 Tax=Pseudarthrobacter sp. 902506025 TaxID=3155291 RepID=UPI003450BB6F
MTRPAGLLTFRKTLEAVTGGVGSNYGHQEPAGKTGDACGTVTAEFAVALPAVLALLAMLLAGAAAGMTQLRIEEGARAGARAVARGDDPAAVERTVRMLAGSSASATVAADGGWFRVTVTDRVPGPLGSSIPWTLTARASTRSETAGTGAAGSGDGSGDAGGVR